MASNGGICASTADHPHRKRKKTRPGAKPGREDRQAGWGFPVVSAKGRIYIFYTMEVDKYDNNRQGCGGLGCVYSDDNGISWSKPEELPMPRSRFDNPDASYPKNWIVWQIPIRDSKGRHLAGYTLVTSKVHVDIHPVWVHSDSRSFFMRFENIDENPGPGDISITWLPDNDLGLEVPNRTYPEMSTCQEPAVVLLPDGRLFTVMRTMTGYVYFSVSGDDGHTWSKPDMLRYTDDGKANRSLCFLGKI